MVEARRELFGVERPASNFVVVADGFARRGQYADAAQLLSGEVADNPGNAEAWVALGNALVEHADGNPTPAAIYAYAKAEEGAPADGARSRRLGARHRSWQEAVGARKRGRLCKRNYAPSSAQA